MITDAEKKEMILAFAANKGWQLTKKLVLEDFHVGKKKLTITYAPLEWINENAKIVIVGITPGEEQARNAYKEAKSELLKGNNLDAVLRNAKYAGSFSGDMRDRLVKALDIVGLNEFLKLPSCSQLFDFGCTQAHFTSLLKFPVFVDNRGYDGKSPIKLTSHPNLVAYHTEYFLKEVVSLKDAIFLPLGQTVRDRLSELSADGILDERQILPWLLHPSKNNRNRYKYFLGEVSAKEASGDTNVHNIDIMRNALQKAIERLTFVASWRELPNAVRRIHR